MATKLSSLSSAGALDTSDVFPLTDTSATTTRITTKRLLDETLRWSELASGLYTATPVYESYASSTFTTIPAWSTGAAKILGNFVKPTSANGYVYECVTAGTTHATTEPVWVTTLGDEITDNTAVWRCTGLNVLATVSDISAWLTKGMALRYIYNSTTYYGLVLYVNATRIALAGAPLSSSYSLTGLAYSPVMRPLTLTLWKNGDYDAGGDVAHEPKLRWLLGNAYLVRFALIHGTNDTGAANPFVNVEVNGAVVSTDGDLAGNPDKGIQASTSWQDNRAVAIKAGNYQVEMGDAINATITTAGSNGDATNLSVVLTFVWE